MLIDTIRIELLWNSELNKDFSLKCEENDKENEMLEVSEARFLKHQQENKKMPFEINLLILHCCHIFLIKSKCF